MKIVKLNFNVWKKLIAKYKICMKSNKALNKEIKEYNKFAKKNNKKEEK